MRPNPRVVVSTQEKQSEIRREKKGSEGERDGEVMEEQGSEGADMA